VSCWLSRPGPRPDPQRIQAAKAAGNLAIVPSGPNSARLDLRNYVKSGDTLSLGLDTAGNALQTVSVKSYLAGTDEMLSRRIGRNELRVIDLCRAYVLMQQEYASEPRDGKLAGLYAQQFRSDPGRQNGLYWEVGPEERQSPLGDLVAKATTEGYDENKSASTPFYGYHSRVLTAQGASAKGGAKDHVVNGEMSAGFGLVAYPAEYGRSGVMTFVVSQDGVVYEADLGEDTAKTASALNACNPDAAWADVKGTGTK
jgi:hypothetical protein